MSWLKALSIVVVLLVAVGQARGAPPDSDGEIERVWTTFEAWEARRAEVLSSDLRGLIDDAQRVLLESTDLSPDDVDRLIEQRRRMDMLRRLDALTVRHACVAQPGAAEEALAWVEALMGAELRSDLGRSTAALSSAVAYAFCHDAWGREASRRVARAMRQNADKILAIHTGNPDSPFNNWWGVTHSAAGLSYLIARDHFPDAAPQLEREKAKVASYVMNYGDAGHYYEGSGYGFYAFSFWGPFALGCEAVDGDDLLRHAPNARRIATCLHALAAPAPFGRTRSGDSTRIGRRLSWNDDGASMPDADIATLALAIANEADRPALLAALHRYCGRDGDGTWLRVSEWHGHPMWLLLYLPLQEPTPPYGEGLPTSLVDQKTGLAVFRSGYEGPDDTVFALYAKSYHGGGHNHADAGSFRLMGLGANWAQGGGQAKRAARYQCVPLRDGGQAPRSSSDEPAPRTGKLSYFADLPHGGAASLDLTNAYAADRVRRHAAVRFDPLPGVEAIVAIYDEISDGAPRGARWDWSMCYDRSLSASIQQSEGFTLADPASNATLRALFAEPAGIALTDNLGPPSQRTFTDRTTVDYPGAKYLLASAGRRERVDFFVVMTLQSGEAPAIRFTETEDGVRAVVGEAWEVGLDRSRWFNGPLWIRPSANERVAVETQGLEAARASDESF